jgi:general secretion pathway protein G
MATVTIIGILASFAMFRAGDSLERARESRAMGDLSALSRELVGLDSLPTSLAGINRATLLDPWGHPYQYVRVIVDPHTGLTTNLAMLRKDRFLVPISQGFDLYSMGPDGRTATSLTSALGADDIVVAFDGGFIGPASTY